MLKAYKEQRIECSLCMGTRLSDNGGATLDSLSFCCDDCGEHFDADSLAEVNDE